MDKRRFDAGGKSATLYMADSENRPLIVLNNYAGDGKAVMAAVSRFEHNEVLKTVRDNTEEIVRYYKEAGLNVVYELNPGNHFKDAEIRSAKGIIALLRQ